MSKKVVYEDISHTMQRPAQGQAKITSKGFAHAMSFASKPVPKKQYLLRFKSKPPTPRPSTWDEHLSWMEYERNEKRFGR